MCLSRPLQLRVRLCVFVVAGLVGFSAFPVALRAQDIVFERPRAGETTIAKKPEITCLISVPYLRETLFVMVDQTDMTGLVTFSESGFTLTPFHVMPAGKHTVSVRLVDRQNKVHDGQADFVTRHSTTFETATSVNSISAVYTQLMAHDEDGNAGPGPHWRVEGNLESDNTVGRGPWTMGLTANARYSDQEHGMAEPVNDGLYLANYLLRGDLEAGSATLDAGLGDLSVEGTSNTIGSLYRRGVALGATTQGFFVKGFSLKSRNEFGERPGEDLSLQNTDHLLGIITGGALFEEKLTLRAIYANGGEDAEAEAFNTWPPAADTRGDVFGLEVKTNFFDNSLVTRLEADWSDYDADTADGRDSDSDKAFQGQVSGTLDFFNYDLLYEYTGADYQVIASSIQKDRKGWTTQAGFNGEGQSVLITVGRYDDNLDRDPDRPRIGSTQYGTTYSFTKFPTLPMSIGWQRSLQDSSHEPAGASRIESTTDSFTGSLSYFKNAFVLGFQPAYSQMDDETNADYDTRTHTLTLFSGFNTERYSLSPSLSFNRYTAESLDVDQDTLSANLSFALRWSHGLSLDGSAAYSQVKSDDDAVDQNTASGDLQLSYTWPEPLGQIFSPSVKLQLSQNHTRDDVAGTDSDETRIYLVLTGTLALSY
ncbi:hypothetical protein JCM14469_25450 [Desulfatiferula olefinivorans]